MPHKNPRRQSISSSLAALAALVLFSCPVHLTAAPPTSDDASSYLFRFDARTLAPKATAVYLAGSFNGWSPQAEPMTRGRDDVFTLRKNLPDGEYQYKFVVIEPEGGLRWLNDPTADPALAVDDANGGLNSGVIIGPDARKLPPPVKGQIKSEVVRFDPASGEDFNIVSPTLAQFSIRLQANDADAVAVVISPSDKGAPTRTELKHLGGERGFDRYAGLVPVPAGPSFAYRFEFVDDGSAFPYGPSRRAGDAAPANVFTATPKVTFVVPDWTAQAVWYQIFPERFRNGDPANDPGDKPGERHIRWQADWWKLAPGETPGAENFYTGAGNVWNRRYGGDIQGLREKLPYLRSLGITALYLNPIFEASSMHKYDTRDYRHIDDNFTVRETLPLEGETDDPKTWRWSKGDLMFLDFVQEAHRQGFKVVLDGVFNHVGRDHPFFLDVVEKGPKSKYASWFDIEKFADKHPADPAQFNKPGGLNYKAWDGPSGNLPNFRKDPKTGLVAGPYEHVMEVTRRWLAPNGDPTKGVDGFRLDVANDIPHPFWIEWRKLVKTTKPDAYISGEIWSNAAPWLKGDQFDGVMNYQFAIAGQKFFANQRTALTPSAFAAELEKLATLYPFQSVLSLMNLYDSHDTDRFASMFVNPDRSYDGQNRLQDSGPNYSPAAPTPEQWQRFLQATAFQMTFVGAPMIYYGSEAGMWSPDDPSNRMPMWWKDLEPFDNPNDRFSDRHFAHYQRAIAVRHALPALRNGFLSILAAHDKTGVVAFSRGDGPDAVIIVLNRSPNEHTVGIRLPSSAPQKLIDWLNPESTEVVPGASDGADARPFVRPRSDALTHIATNGTVGVTLKPWAVMVLASPGK